MARIVLVGIMISALVWSCEGPGAPTADGDAIDVSDGSGVDEGDGVSSDDTPPDNTPSLDGDAVAIDQVVVGARRVCARSGSDLWCWGYGVGTLIGDDGGAATAVPVLVSSEVADIGGEGDSLCVAETSGAVRCTGGTYHLLLAQEGNSPPERFELVHGITRVVKVDAGRYHACALDADSALWCWGWNGPGLITPTEDSGVLQPTVVLEGVLDFAVADVHTCAVLEDRSIGCWGFGGDGRLGSGLGSPVHTVLPSPAASISAGGATTCAVTEAMDAWCWGDAWASQIGDGSTGARLRPFHTDGRVSSVSVGDAAICIVRTDGKVECAGWNGSYVVDPSSESETTDGTTIIEGVDDAVAVAVGETTCAILDGGSLSCWGSNAYGMAGIGTSLLHTDPQRASSVDAATSIAAGAGHTCAVYEDGTVGCWGSNSDGQLGSGAVLRRDQATPADLADTRDSVEVVVGDDFGCVRNAEQTHCWGSNERSQLAREPGGFSDTPVKVGAADEALDLAAGHGFMCALLPEHRVTCWGADDFGQLGNHRMEGASLPSQMETDGFSSVSQVAGGRFSACLVGVGRSGDAWHGCTGRPPLFDFYAFDPMSPPLDAEPVGITVGMNHVCALESNGAVLCYGANQHGQVNPASPLTTADPQRIELAGPATSVVAGHWHTCAIIDDDAWCWGDNRFGQLADEDLGSARGPIRIALPAGVEEIAAGADHTCARLIDGAVWCWGENAHGKLGIASDTLHVRTPTEVRFTAD